MSDASESAVTLLSLQDAAAHIGRHAQTILRWYEAGDFKPGEMYQLPSTRGRGKAWCVDLEAARRVARSHWTPAPAKPNLFAVGAPHGVVYVPAQPRPSQRQVAPARRVTPPVATPPRDPDQTKTKKLHPKSGPPLPSYLRSIHEVQRTHGMAMSRRRWLTAARRGLLQVTEGAWRNARGVGHVGFALDEANQRAFGRLFVPYITPCGVVGCLVCEGRAGGGRESGINQGSL